MKNLHQVRPPTPTDLDPDRYYAVEVDHARISGVGQVTLQMRLRNTTDPWFEFIGNRFYWRQSDCDSVNNWRRDYNEAYPLSFYGSELMLGTNG